MVIISQLRKDLRLYVLSVDVKCGYWKMKRINKPEGIKIGNIYLVLWDNSKLFSVETVTHVFDNDVHCITIKSNASWMKKGTAGCIPLTKAHHWYEISEEEMEDAVMAYSI